MRRKWIAYQCTLEYNRKGQLMTLIHRGDGSGSDSFYPYFTHYKYKRNRLIHLKSMDDYECHRSFDRKGNLIMEQSFVGKEISEARIGVLSDSLRHFFNKCTKSDSVWEFLYKYDTSISKLIIYNYGKMGLSEVLMFDRHFGVSRILLEYNSSGLLSKAEYWNSSHLRTVNEFDYIPGTRKLQHKRSLHDYSIEHWSTKTYDIKTYIDDYYFKYRIDGEIELVYSKSNVTIEEFQ